MPCEFAMPGTVIQPFAKYSLTAVVTIGSAGKWFSGTVEAARSTAFQAVAEDW